MWGGNGSSSYLSLTAEFPDVICHTSDFVTTTVRAVSSVGFLSKKLFLSDTRKEKFVFFGTETVITVFAEIQRITRMINQPTNEIIKSINQQLINPIIK